jgi:phosphoribosylformylglycinamidine synthase
VGGEVNFHPAYNGNPLVNAMTVGIAPADRIFYAKATGTGNPVVYVGSKTGRDGIHGASMASAEFGADAEEKRPTVQVGDPFTEKLLLEACLELMRGDAVVAIQDMGAAGLTSSSVEMASKGGVGIDLDLDRVPCRETGMDAYEIMLSESQERMLMVLRPDREDAARAVFEKWELDFAVIGQTTDTGRLVLRHHGAVAADLPLSALADEAPVYDRPWRPTEPRPVLDPQAVPAPNELGEAILRLIGSPDLCSRRWVWEQYDHMVMGDTVQRPGGDAAVVRVHGTGKGVAMTTDVTPRYCAADPVVGGRQAVAEAWRNLTAVGAEPLAITDCLNFGNPERPATMGQLVGCIQGLAEACRALAFPVVSGNVSLYNETEGAAIPPTPAVGGVGLIADLDATARIGLSRDGDAILLIGETVGHLGASIYLRDVLGRAEGAPPPVDLEVERRNGDFIRGLIRRRTVGTVHDLSDGGLAIALIEMALAGGRGATVTPPGSDLPQHAWLFGEDQARYLVALDPAAADAVLAEAAAAGVPAARIGTAGGDAVVFGATRLSLDRLRATHEGWFPNYMAAPA